MPQERFDGVGGYAGKGNRLSIGSRGGSVAVGVSKRVTDRREVD